jgi:hypothetical protein
MTSPARSVDREAERSGQVPDAAAQRQAADTGRRDDPERRRQAERGRRVVDFAEQRSAEHLRSGVLRVDDDTPEQREIDHETVVDAPEAGAVVAAAADGDIQARFAAGLHGRDHVSNVCALRDHARTLVDHR